MELRNIRLAKTATHPAIVRIFGELWYDNKRWYSGTIKDCIEELVVYYDVPLDNFDEANHNIEECVLELRSGNAMAKIFEYASSWSKGYYAASKYKTGPQL